MSEQRIDLIPLSQPATPYLIAQLAYDRVRKVLRQDGLDSAQVEAWLENACQQLLGTSLQSLAEDVHFALHLEQATHGNAYPHY
jgi:uncharacterized protein YfaA (DUF2138 family)